MGKYGILREPGAASGSTFNIRAVSDPYDYHIVTSPNGTARVEPLFGDMSPGGTQAGPVHLGPRVGNGRGLIGP